MAATAFTEAQIRRAVKGALDAGFPVGIIEVVLSDGQTIRILPEQIEPAKKDKRKPEAW